jgi:pheromone a factor receptor
MGYYPNYVYSIFSFLAFVLVSIPFPWHFEAWNTGTCLYMAWTSISCLNLFINSIVWNGNAINWAPVWCDISTRIMIGMNVAIPAASLCINRRLYHISRCSSVTVTKKEKRRAILVDLCIGLGIPFIQMCLQYIVQGHRFNIYGDIGCFPFTYNVWPAYVLVSCWPIAIGFVSAIYCILSIRAFARRRSQFKELLSANSNLNSNRYFRLMCLAGIEVVCTIPLASWAMYLNIHTIHLFPYKGWANTHWGFSRVDQFPALIWHENRLLVLSLELTRWSPVICAFIFFIFFGFADEARKHYRLAYTSVAKRMGYTVTTSSSGFTTSSSNGQKKSFPYMSSIGHGALPIFVRKEATSNRDSLGSFTLTIADAGGLLEDCKSPNSIYSPTESTLSTSQTYLPSPSDIDSPSLLVPPALPRPEPTLDLSSPIRISSDTSPTSPKRLSL